MSPALLLELIQPLNPLLFPTQGAKEPLASFPAPRGHKGPSGWWIPVARCEQEDEGCTPGCIPQSYFTGWEGGIRDITIFFIAVSLLLAMPAVWVDVEAFL